MTLALIHLVKAKMMENIMKGTIYSALPLAYCVVHVVAA